MDHQIIAEKEIISIYVIFLALNVFCLVKQAHFLPDREGTFLFPTSNNGPFSTCCFLSDFTLKIIIIIMYQDGALGRNLLKFYIKNV